MGSYQEKLAKTSAQKADLEVQLVEFTDKLAEEERMKSMAGDDKRVMDREMGNIKQELADMQAKVKISTIFNSKFFLKFIFSQWLII